MAAVCYGGPTPIQKPEPDEAIGPGVHLVHEEAHLIEAHLTDTLAVQRRAFGLPVTQLYCNGPSSNDDYSGHFKNYY